ncbi:hypothetical protein D3C72_1689220 [compost metagenome]
MSFFALKILVSSFSFFLTIVSFLLTVKEVSRNILLTTESASIRLVVGRNVRLVLVKRERESFARKIILSTDFLMRANSSERCMFCSSGVLVENDIPFLEERVERESI